MGFAVAEQGWRKGPWTPEEDKLLVEYVSSYGEGRWSCVSKCAGTYTQTHVCVCVFEFLKILFLLFHLKSINNGPTSTA